MKKHLQLILSLLCVLALAFGITAALADDNEARIITVQWSDNNNYDLLRPDHVTVSLAGSAPLRLDDTNGWSGEVSVPAGTANDWTYDSVEGYTATLNKGNVSTLTYYHATAPSIPSVTANVYWPNDDNNARKTRPASVKLMLLADGEPYGEPKDAKPSDWQVSWTDLPLRKPGKDTNIVYSVVQLQDPAGYTGSVSGMNVTNTLKTATLTVDAVLSGYPEGADLSALKLTVDGPDPSMPRTLSYADIAKGPVQFTSLLPGAYLIRDNNADLLVEGYTMDTENSKVCDAAYITDSGKLEFRYAYKLPEAIEDAEEDYDPTANLGSLTFEILGPSNEPDYKLPVTVTYAEFTNDQYVLPMNLLPGVYTVVERNAEKLVKYYTLTSDSMTAVKLEVKGNADGTATTTAKLRNQYIPAPTPEPDAEFVDIPVTKTWNDNGNKDGNRPASITVRLYADGVEVDSYVLTAASNWTCVFTGKPRYQEDNKTEIVYSVDEDDVPMYTKEINGYNIVNDYLPEVTSRSVSKVWHDDNNAQKLRPESIVMTLSDGSKTVATVLLNAGNGWTATVNDLPTVVDGKTVTYSWSEQTVLSYTLENVEDDGSVMVFHNYVWERPETPTRGGTPPTAGKPVETLEDYETPLGVEVIINHVGDCFD